MKITKTLVLPLERLRLLEQSMIMMRLQLYDHPASATEGSPAVFEFSLSNPSAVDTTYTLHSPMELLEVLITLPLQTVTVPAGATTGTVKSYNC
jgi:hypothetical protein